MEGHGECGGNFTAVLNGDRPGAMSMVCPRCGALREIAPMSYTDDRPLRGGNPAGGAA